MMLAVKLGTPGPAIFSQKRLGFGGKFFTCFKLRSMHSNELEQETSIGKILRRTGLDELPQLWNILRGEMAFVGPRPISRSRYLRFINCPPCLLRDLWKKKWNSVLPGITGYSQISPHLSKAEADLFYIENKSFRLDAWIIIKTFPLIFNKKKKSPQNLLGDVKQTPID